MKPFLALSYCISQPANKFYFANNFIMKVNRERNPYLKRIFSEQPHKYSYSIAHSAMIFKAANTRSSTNKARPWILTRTELSDQSLDQIIAGL